MGLINNEKKESNKETVEKKRFYVNIENGDSKGSPMFTPTKGFAHMTPKEAIGVLKNADLDVTKESKGYVNFSLSFRNRTIGFINFYDNNLNDLSTDTEKQLVLAELVVKLNGLTLADIQVPITRDEADDILTELVA